MDRLDSMWEVYLRKGISRRSFIKSCVALTGMLGLGPGMLSQVVAAAEKNSLPVVIWLHGQE